MKDDCRRAGITSPLQTLTPLLDAGAVSWIAGVVRLRTVIRTMARVTKEGKSQLDLGR